MDVVCRRDVDVLLLGRYWFLKELQFLFAVGFVAWIIQVELRFCLLGAGDVCV